MSGDLAIIRGIPLAEEPGLGPLTLPGFLAEVRDRFGPREALVMFEGAAATGRWTYDDLWERAQEVARALIAGGLGKGEYVGVLMTNRLEWVSSCFGVALAGGVTVGLSTFSTAEELEQLLALSGVSVLLFERMSPARISPRCCGSWSRRWPRRHRAGWLRRNFPTFGASP